jgi:hypothetical protein
MTTFTKVVGFWAPRRHVSAEGIDVDSFVADVEQTARTQGFITADGQVLSRLDPVEEWEEYFEPGSLDSVHGVPRRRPWGDDQRAYFGLDHPYQMADDPDSFTWSSICTRIADPRLWAQERIVGIVHGEQDRCYFTCPCHYASVVYTTRHRLVCMSCGATHVVLRHPLSIPIRQTITAEEWDQIFGEDGVRRHEEVDLATIDVRDIEGAELIWVTDQWDEALREFVLFARTPREEFLRAVRGTELDPDLGSVLLEDGWQPVDEPPAPAFQLRDDSVDVDLVQNAERAFCQGVAAYLAAYLHPDRLLGAIPALFRAIELLLKARLELIDRHGLEDHPNNPTVLDRLLAGDVALAEDEIEMIAKIRRLRNDLQHGTARFNHRRGLGLCRQAIAFVDRFAYEELGIWTGDAKVPAHQWQQLLTIDTLAERAACIASSRADRCRSDRESIVMPCPVCSKETMVRPRPDAGAECVYCRHIPITPSK